MARQTALEIPYQKASPSLHPRWKPGLLALHSCRPDCPARQLGLQMPLVPSLGAQTPVCAVRRVTLPPFRKMQLPNPIATEYLTGCLCSPTGKRVPMKIPLSKKPAPTSGRQRQSQIQRSQFATQRCSASLPRAIMAAECCSASVRRRPSVLLDVWPNSRGNRITATLNLP